MRELTSQAARALRASEEFTGESVLTNEPGPKLHFLVYDTARELCRVTLPLAAVENLEHLFPDEDLQRVKDSGLNLREVVQRARESGYSAQLLVDTQTAQRSYRIWIE